MAAVAAAAEAHRAPAGAAALDGSTAVPTEKNLPVGAVSGWGAEAADCHGAVVKVRDMAAEGPSRS